MPPKPENAAANVTMVPEEITGQPQHWLGVPWTVAIGAVAGSSTALLTWLFVRHSPPSPG